MLERARKFGAANASGASLRGSERTQGVFGSWTVEGFRW